MTGFLLYMVTAVGLGALFPRPASGGQSWMGVRTFGGVCLAIILLYVLQVLLGVGLVAANRVVAGLGATGSVWLVWRHCRQSPAPSNALHPVVLLSLAVLAVAAVRGGIGYIPYTGDDFMTWVGKARTIYAVGDYTRAVPDLHLAYYTPGWPLFLLYPWALFGNFDPGQAAGAPAAMHVALLGLFFDGALSAMARRNLGSPGRRLLWAWLFILAALLAELSGKLFPLNLLIEPPQVYCLCALLVIALMALDDPEATPVFAVPMGVVVAASYLIKVAALAFVPALAVLAFCLARQPGRRAGALLGIGAWLFLPVAAAYLSWKAVGPPSACLGSVVATLSAENLSRLLSPEAADLGGRYGTAVWRYVAAYKAPLSIAALAGMAWSLAARKHASLTLVFSLYCLVYFAALYWYHLACFGDFYFRNLNSIPRFTRVPVRAFHVLGIVLLALMVLEAVGRDAPTRLRRLVLGQPGVVAAILTLTAWQVWQLDRSIRAVSTRAHQTIEPYLAAISRESSQIKVITDAASLAEPRVLVIYQDTDGTRDLATLDTYFGATYYGMGSRRGEGARRFRVLAYAPTDVTTALFRDADVVWPLRVNRPTRALIARFVSDRACRENLEAFFLLAVRRGKPGLRCVAKTSIHRSE